MSNWDFDLAPVDVKPGDTKKSEITTTDDDGANVTASAVALRVRKDDASADAIVKALADAEITAVSGLVTINYTNAMTSPLTAGSYIVQVIITTSGGQRTGHGRLDVRRVLP